MKICIFKTVVVAPAAFAQNCVFTYTICVELFVQWFLSFKKVLFHLNNKVEMCPYDTDVPHNLLFCQSTDDVQ
jgi:hypothetical protein